MSKPAVGFVGLGAMGFGMATHLVKEGYPVHGFDVFPASVERFKAAGGIPASSLQDSADGKEYYVCMVASAPQVQTVLFGEGGIVAGVYQRTLNWKTGQSADLAYSSPSKRNPSSLLHRPCVLCPVRRGRAAIAWPWRHSVHRCSCLWRS
jgi:hypothetical protein